RTYATGAGSQILDRGETSPPFHGGFESSSVRGDEAADGPRGTPGADLSPGGPCISPACQRPVGRAETSVRSCFRRGCGGLLLSASASKDTDDPEIPLVTRGLKNPVLRTVVSAVL